MSVENTTSIIRLLVTFGLTFALGFERQLRGSPAGNRTFSLIGLGAALTLARDRVIRGGPAAPASGWWPRK